MNNTTDSNTGVCVAPKVVPLWVAAIPVVALLGALIAIISFVGADAVSDYSAYILLLSASLASVLSLGVYKVRRRRFMAGMARSTRQMLPCVPLLVLIATVSTSWMLSGVVPYLVERGIALLNPTYYLAITCLACAVVSSLTGSSWTTIATVGAAFLGVGSVFGYNPAWTAGAIISGAYFGDKFSPLSDTTVIAAATTGVDIFKLIRYMVVTTIPAFAVSLAIFAWMGVGHQGVAGEESARICRAIGSTFNLTPWVMLVPATTIALIALRLSTLLTLVGSTIAGIVGMFVFQGDMLAYMGVTGFVDSAVAVGDFLINGAVSHTGLDVVDNLVTTGGITGMLSTIFLVLSAMMFGGAMMGSGFLERLTRTMASRLTRRHSVVSATVATGVTLNTLTADQYVSIIIGGNVYKNVYKRSGLSPRLLGRTIQDSVPVTSVLIPWNSCGVTQSAVLGVATIAYLPYCLFNILSPVSSVVVATVTYHIKHRRIAVAAKTNPV